MRLSPGRPQADVAARTRVVDRWLVRRVVGTFYDAHEVGTRCL